MFMQTRMVISKSAKRKCTSVVDWSGERNGKNVTERVTRQRANDFTEQVVYKTKKPNGKFTSVTRHEIAR
jgi:hypothetical protein